MLRRSDVKPLHFLVFVSLLTGWILLNPLDFSDSTSASSINQVCCAINPFPPPLSIYGFSAVVVIAPVHYRLCHYTSPIYKVPCNYSILSIIVWCNPSFIYPFRFQGRGSALLSTPNPPIVSDRLTLGPHLFNRLIHTGNGIWWASTNRK